MQEKVCRLLAFLCTRWTSVNCTKYSLQLLQLEEVMSLRHQLKRLTTSDRVTLVARHQSACTRKAGWVQDPRFCDKTLKAPVRRVCTRKAQVIWTKQCEMHYFSKYLDHTLQIFLQAKLFWCNRSSLPSLLMQFIFLVNNTLQVYIF